jgi:hypothetical protein
MGRNSTQSNTAQNTDDDEMGVRSNVTMKILGYELSSVFE